MTPNFALSLSYEGIVLLHRAAAGWQRVGEVSLAAKDLDADLDALRTRTSVLHPGGIQTKLIIPNEQIRFLTLDTGDVDTDARFDAARAALDGATPYRVDELVIDLSAEGTKTHVAAVARETLDEAESFALQYQFNPLSFVAIPALGTFAGEVFFGATFHARSVLPEGVSVTRDAQAIIMAPPPPLPVDAPEIVEDAADEPLAPPGAPTDETPAVEAVDADIAADVEEADPPRDTPAPDAADQPFTEDGPKPVAEAAEEAAPFVPASFSSRRHRESPAPALGGVTRADAPPREDPVAEAKQDPAPELSENKVEPPIKAAPPPLPQPRPVPDTLAELSPAPAASKPRQKADTARDAEAERLTIFGARGSANQVGGKPRFLGVTLTVALLAGLLGVGTLSAMFSDDGLANLFSPTDVPQIAEPAEPIAPPAALPEPETDVAEAPEEPTTEVAALETDLTDEDAAVLDALTDPRPSPDIVPALTPQELEARYAVSGIWPTAPEAPLPAALVDLDDLYETSIDSGAAPGDAVALLRPDPSEPAPEPVPSPAPPGIAFDLDERGLVRATPEGAVNPNGVLVYLGPPPVKPDNYPDRTARTLEDPTPALDPAFEAARDIRPRLRPTDLIEDNERASLGGLTRNELAEYRPRLRPALERTVEQAEAEAQDAPLSELAIATSLRPDLRPRNFAQIVARAAPRPAPQETRVAAVAPRTVQPSIPSSASVTRQATVENALNLRRINLIGVFGKPSERRALVRMPNGRYRKVQVGDRLDGGRVSAIGDSELRYQKGSRNLVLKMPQS